MWWTVNQNPYATGYERLAVVNLFDCAKVVINNKIVHSSVIADGKLYEFGNRYFTGATNQPTLASAETGWTDVAATARYYADQSRYLGYSMGIRNGELYSWGYAVPYSEFASNPLSGRPITQIGALTGWSSVSCNGNRAAGICDGKLYTWGLDGQRIGQAGTDSPAQIGALTDWTYARVTDFVIFAIRAGQLFAVGTNSAGLLGMGDTADHGNTFTQVGTLTGWTFVGEGIGNMGFGICDGDLMLWRPANGYVPTAVQSAVRFVKAVHKGSTSSTGINDLYLLGEDSGLYHFYAGVDWDAVPEPVYVPAIVSNHDNHEWLDITGDGANNIYGYLLAIRKS